MLSRFNMAFTLWLSHNYISTSSFRTIEWLAIDKFRFELGTKAVGLVFSVPLKSLMISVKPIHVGIVIPVQLLRNIFH